MEICAFGEEKGGDGSCINRTIHVQMYTWYMCCHTENYLSRRLKCIRSFYFSPGKPSKGSHNIQGKGEKSSKILTSWTLLLTDFIHLTLLQPQSYFKPFVLARPSGKAIPSSFPSPTCNLAQPPPHRL